MYKAFVSILATASVALASTSPIITAETGATGATIMLPSSPAASSTSRGSAITTTAALLVTRAPSVDPTTLRTVTHPHRDPRGHGGYDGPYSNPRYSFISDYDGRIITEKLWIPATTLDYHGTHPLTLLESNRCPNCDRVLDPYDQQRYNGRYDGGRHSWDSEDDDLYWGNRDTGLRFGPENHGRPGHDGH
ncbi:uncharacterized protein ALTATR162_LOCUS4441 [Alternaria atra]|uniref:Uncharacterized protein n=1 Tax=Alternaria atra TaxID=119953 RepID=A0A8J2I885_9PLEO|nr:uncharacterized protein ALTATR162_LOCUS4441 [Alternaria atra]CAG5156644.1 unnamed protein product [Alternaria atra]